MIRNLIADCGGTGRAGNAQAWAAQLRQQAPDDRARAFVTQLAVEPLRVPRADGEADARYVQVQLARLEAQLVNRSIVRLKSRVQRLNPLDHQPEYNRAFGDLIALEQRHKALLEREAGDI